MTEKIRVLYVDDELDLLKIGKIYLERDGTFTVDTLTSASEALTRLKTEWYDTIISDYQMPEMDGITLLKLLKASGNTTPFIIFTGRGREEVAIEALNSGADFYLQKGGDPKSQFAELAHKIRSATSLKKANKAQQESEEKYRTVFENTGTATVVLEESGIISLANEEFAQLCGFSKDAIEGKKSWTEFVVKEDLERMQAQHRLRRQDEAKALTHYEFRFVTKTGDLRNIYLSIGVIPGTKKSVASLLDITDRKRAEELYRTIFENTGTAMIILEEDNTISYVNDAMEKISGYSKEEIEGRVKWMTLVAAEDLEKMLEYHRLRRACPDSAPRNYECRFVHKNGGLMDAALTVSMIPGTNKSVISLRDITEFNKTVVALKESEAQYRTIIENMQDLFYRTDLQGNITMVSPRGARLAGYASPDVLIGRNAARDIYADPKERDRFLAVLAEKGEVNDCPVTLNAGDGTIRFATASSHFYYDSHGKVLGVEGILHDVTERTRAEDALKESEAKFKTLFESAGDAIFIMDRHVFLDCNKRTEEIFGCSRDQIIGHSPSDFSPERQPDGQFSTEKVKEKIDPAFSGENQFFYWVHVKYDSTPFNAEVSLNRVMLEGNYYLQAIVRDITDRKVAEEQALLATELRKFSVSLATANKKLTLLSSITRHDINNQLGLLMGFLAILKKKQPDPSFNDYFQKIATTAQRISAMIQFTMDYELVGVNAPIWQDCSTLVDTAAKQAPLGQITVKNDIPAGMEVLSDPLIVKVFYNLMDNAVRYGKKITTIRFSVEERDDNHVVMCEDDGDGVLAEEKEKIFERGFGKNTGLGLALSREILNITGITLKETGEPGKGARFEIVVPMGAYRDTDAK